MHPRHSKRKIRVLDGSFSAELQNVVKDYFNKDRPNWTFDAVIDNPEAVKAVHERFIDAGVDDIETNTYHAALPMLEKQGYNGAELIKKAVNILKETVYSYKPKEARRMWGSVGSYAICFRGCAAEYTGAFVDDAQGCDIVKVMADYHKNQIEAMKNAGMNNLLFETISTTKEAQAICAALDGHSDVQAVVSFTCRQDGVSIRHGESFKDAVKIVTECPRVIGFGINCTHPDVVSSLLQSVRSIQHEKEIFVYPNSGKYELKGGERPPMDIILSSVEEWIALGATVIGGCCGIEASDIRHIRQKVDDHNSILSP
ncbi:unnamed protein product [Heligmosomoides polygyrus]|uniref:Hcy-binding domain-containing protein n=1 Tax=Heligmosomoides polygyrus TaxID=6339 RepID=A0A183FH19_HELPZ|nr:unnamed protein product [Heligmosomoides polygyrus]